MSEILDIKSIDSEEDVSIPMLDEIHAGFPSPAEDIFEGSINLNKVLISNPNATFYARVKGDSMVDAGIDEGDVLIIDKSKEPTTGAVAVCYIDGEFTVKKIKIEKDKCILLPANDKYPEIVVDKYNDFVIWGTVSYIIKKV
jgi:DNA polymerase V